MTEFQLAFSTVDEGDYFTGAEETFERMVTPSTVEPGIYRLMPDGQLELVEALPAATPANAEE